jgi:hypothetical protein
MPVGRAELTLVVPGLLGPHPPIAAAERLALAAPALEVLLGRGRVSTTPTVGVDPTLFHLFGLTPDAEGWPIAPVSARGDGLVPGADYWLRMDPVGLQPDRDRLVLLDGASLAITDAEAQALIARLRTTLGLDCYAAMPQRWYLRLTERPDLRTHALADVIARPLDRFLPEGPDAARWRARVTEIEMVLHAHPVNRAREAAGRPMINGVWLWGGGRAPAAVSAPWSRVYDDDAIGRGLALTAAIPVDDIPTGADALLAGIEPDARVLAVLHDAHGAILHGDVQRWTQAVTDLSRRWLEPVRRALAGGALARLELWSGDGRCWQITGGDLRRFWRPRRPIWAYGATRTDG